MSRGEVVLLDWPYSDLTGSKLRPAVVVQGDWLNGLIDDTVYVKIQSKPSGIPGIEIKLDPTVETTSGLLKTSYASCRDLLTRDQALIHHTLGVLSVASMREIELGLRRLLDLP